MPDWKAGEGQLLGGIYPLDRFVHGDDESALFITGSGAAAIRICRVSGAAQASEIVAKWNRARRLPHANLIRIHATGTADLLGAPVAWLAMEYAEENLADVLRSRPLEPEEARAMLLPVAAALDYLHRRGLAHRGLKPSHIFAVGDTVKLSSESIAEGDPSTDIQSLGATLEAAFAPGAVPPPFDSIAAGCLHPDPGRRWTAGQVVARLSGDPPPTALPRSALRRFAAPAALATVTAAILIGVVLRRSDAPPPVVPPAASAPINPQPTPPPPVPAPKSVDAPPVARTQSRDRLVVENSVVRRVLPDVPSTARSTITGKPSLVVRVTVDPAGNVTDAAVERTFSPYFSRLALDAARQWKFVPSQGAAPRHWNLRFEFTATGTNASAR